jgi:hydroxyethylthiazole kinase
MNDNNNVNNQEIQQLIWHDVQKIRSAGPLVHNITNYVVMNTTANALLAVGASPLMAHAIEEAADITGLSQALVLNIGTLSAPWIDAMLLSGKEAKRRNLPVVLDPVGCGATRFRTDTAHRLIQEIQPTVIRGNASEIRALVIAGSGSKGVDSLHTPDEVLNDAVALSLSVGCVVSVSGPVDLIVEGNTVLRVANGTPMMTRVTGMGCTASALTGAFLAVNQSALQAARNAMAVMGIAGEMAGQQATGPGSFQVAFLDALYGMTQAQLAQLSMI